MPDDAAIAARFQDQQRQLDALRHSVNGLPVRVAELTVEVGGMRRELHDTTGELAELRKEFSERRGMTFGEKAKLWGLTGSLGTILIGIAALILQGASS